MRAQRSERRQVRRQSAADDSRGLRSGKLVAEVDNISFAYGDGRSCATFRPPSCAATRSASSGPTVPARRRCLRVLLGPTRAADRARCARARICKSPISINCASSSTTISRCTKTSAMATTRSTIGGRPRHIIGYLQDFLFSPERPARRSGFSRRRAQSRAAGQAVRQPANVIVLDEPTNDLDAETLELLEERLVQFKERCCWSATIGHFLNNVVTSTIVFEDGGVREYVGGYDDWLRQRAKEVADEPELKPAQSSPANAKAESAQVNGDCPLRDSRNMPGCRHRSKQRYPKSPNCIKPCREPNSINSQGAKIISEAGSIEELGRPIVQGLSPLGGAGATGGMEPCCRVLRPGEEILFTCGRGGSGRMNLAGPGGLSAAGESAHRRNRVPRDPSNPHFERRFVSCEKSMRTLLLPLRYCFLRSLFQAAENSYASVSDSRRAACSAEARLLRRSLPEMILPQIRQTAEPGRRVRSLGP